MSKGGRMESVDKVKERERACPWCGETMVAEVRRRKVPYGDVVERLCPKCGKVVAAYLEQEGDFLMEMRSY